MLLILLASAVGCVSNRSYRPESVTEMPGYTLAFVEVDDQGELWDPRQLGRVLERITAANQELDGAIVSVFVHGWNDNASPRNERSPSGALYGFKNLLTRISTAEASSSTRRPVIGIYLAWRGKAVRFPFDLLTFYNRRAAAARVASPSTTSALFRIMAGAKQNPRSKCLLVGHSFGATILEQALAPALIGGLVSNRDVALPADLVVLLNDASRSIHAKQLIEILERNRLKLRRRTPDGREYDRPLIVSVTSEGDLATRILLPIGNVLASANQNFRAYADDSCTSPGRQRSFAWRTPGHQRRLFSHRVDVEPSRIADTREGDRAKPRDTELEAHFDPYTQEEAMTFDGIHQRFTLRKIPNAFNDTAYWIMRVPESLIPSHSKIFGDNTLRLLAALMTYSGALEPSTVTRVAPDSGVHPVGIYTSAEGRIFMLARSRRVYEIADGTFHSVSCLPAKLEPTEVIGGGSDHRGGAVVVHRPRQRPGRGYETEIIPFALRAGQFKVARSSRLATPAHYTAAAVDLGAGKGFLVASGTSEVWSFSLSERRPRPELLSRLDSGSPLVHLFHQEGLRLLFASDESGSLWSLDPADSRRVHLVAKGLGAPSALAFDPIRERLYVADGRDGRLWRLSRSADSFDSPELFAAGVSLIKPVSIAIGADSSVWVADPEAQRVLQLAPDGSVRTVLGRLTETGSGPPS